MVAADYSLLAAEPVGEPCAEVIQDTPTVVASIEAAVGDEAPPEGGSGVINEPTKSVDVGIPVSAQSPTSEADGGKVAAAVSDVDDEPSDAPVIDGVVVADEENPPSYPEALGEADEGAPEANIVDKVARADVLLADTEEPLSSIDSEVDIALLRESRPETEPAAEAKAVVESASDMVVGTESGRAEEKELVPVPAAKVGFEIKPAAGVLPVLI